MDNSFKFVAIVLLSAIAGSIVGLGAITRHMANDISSIEQSLKQKD